MQEKRVNGQAGGRTKTAILKKKIGARSLIAFWLLGLCNNYGYVVMLSAAHDILADDSGHENVTATIANSTRRDCNKVSTGAILLADIIPSLMIKIIAPFFPLCVHVRLVLVLILSCSGYILVATEQMSWAITGVIFTALSSGLGEATLLSYMSFYRSINIISTWSSGTGAAGVFGSTSYAGLKALGLSHKATLYSLTSVTVVMAISFWLILEHPKFTSPDENNETVESVNPVGPCGTSTEENSSNDASPLTNEKYNFQEKIKYMPSLLKYMIPLGLVYLFEYLINQGLFELIQYDSTSLDYSEQYRWYQVDYQIGVFISRSSVNFFTIRKVWILAVLQGLNIFIFATEAIYSYLPHIAVILLFVLWEGLLGGAAYVNTFQRILNEEPPERKEFAMGITSLADALGITIAGFSSIPIHNAICNLPKMNVF